MLPLTNDSEHSTSSTITVEYGSHKSLDQHRPQPSLPQQRQRKLKRVRFDERRNQSFAHLDEERTAEDCRQTWYTSNDYEIMRNNMRRDILDLQTKHKNAPEDDQEYSFCEILQALLKLVTSIQHEIKCPSTILNEEVEHMLSQLYSRGQESLEMIGLEMRLESKLRRTAKEHRDQIQDMVYDIQKEHLAGILSDAEVHDELRDCCLNYSQPFVLLAHFRARAQLLA